MKILNFGSLNLDYVYQVDHLVREGETISSQEMNVHLGGKGFNQSCALARAGVPVYHAGTVGDDGLIFYDTCEDFGVDTEYLRSTSGRCGHAIIQVDKAGSNCIMLYGGANMRITRKQVDEVLSHFGPKDYIILQNEISELDYIIEQAFMKGMIIVLNPSPFNERLLACDLGKVSYFILNETEAGQLTGEIAPSAMLQTMGTSYPNAKIVLTLGDKGAVYHHGNEEIFQPAYPVQVVDTTGAGDCFTGFFMAGIFKKKTIKEAMALAAKAAAMCIGKAGAAESMPFLSEVELYES